MSDEEIALVSRVRPKDSAQDAGAKARARARLHAEFTAPSEGRRRVARPRRGRRFLAVGAAAAACAAAGIVVVSTGGHKSSSPADVTTRTLELAAATVETGAPAARPRPQQWVYTLKMEKYALQNGDVVGPDAGLHGKVKVEEWWRFDGKRTASSVQNGKLTVQGILPSMKSRPPRHKEPGVDNYTGGPAVVRSTPNHLYDYVADLPTTPGALLARIRHDSGDAGHDVSTFGSIAQILSDDRLMPPKANAALYRALALIPGVRVAKDGTDYAGRHGIAVIFGNGKGVQEIILDRRTYHYMGDPTEAILSFRVVDDAGQRG
ncbi:CU044_5270 family protein [Actinoallomurus sp. NPDC050550]|uniref:CU044_5270 family protein n=1 Tax=Actinoallomurus sp. NPDC050550 TaxID=3154937 RepID=UPI0033CF43C3